MNKSADLVTLGLQSPYMSPVSEYPKYRNVEKNGEREQQIPRFVDALLGHTFCCSSL